MRIDRSLSGPWDERYNIAGFNQRSSLLLQGHRDIAVTFLSPMLCGFPSLGICCGVLEKACRGWHLWSWCSGTISASIPTRPGPCPAVPMVPAVTARGSIPAKCCLMLILTRSPRSLIPLHCFGNSLLSWLEILEYYLPTSPKQEFCS